MLSSTSKSFPIIVQCCRTFTLSCPPKYDWNAQAKFMNKLLSNKMERKIQRLKNATHVVQILDKQRRTVLQKTYMRNISEVLAFGGFEELLNKDIQISRVIVRSTDAVEVYWLANENEDPAEIQNILSSISPKVGSQLMYANMGGLVPKIIFKHDASAIQLQETIKLLDQVSLQNSHYDKLPSEMNDSGINIEDLNERASLTMRMDVLGLPYDSILNRIKEAKRKSYPVQIPLPPSPEEFQNLQNKQLNLEPAVERHVVQKRELKKFMNLYQKSALRSNSRKKNFENRDIFVDDDDNYNSHDCKNSSFYNDWEGRHS